MIFDTSVWIDFSKGKVTSKSELLRDRLYNNFNVSICPSILQEVLQGCSSTSQFIKLRERLLALELLESNEYMISIKAAQMYFQLRKKGITIRKPNDCIIAIYALEFDIQLVHNDKDFDEIAKIFPLKIYNPITNE